MEVLEEHRCRSRSPQTGVQCTKDQAHILEEDPLKRSHESRNPQSLSGISWSSMEDTEGVLKAWAREILRSTLPENEEFERYWAARWTYLNGQTPAMWLERGGARHTVIEGATAFREGASI